METAVRARHRVFMETMLMFMHLPTGGMREMPAQEQDRWHGGRHFPCSMGYCLFDGTPP
ncbi:hypothetical protein [Akkermansia muciniphila]|jgi:hypothetical protein|uniref:hypothetical protein n=1 Tax=Akkermansia muciniphila TaxID=239935 RepID=UPI0013E8BEAE|nr:hypothetical protein [Akkermansia muciniphila]QWO97737.1 hypothetical protein J5W71_08290 [Akkermansia muciniphila]